MTDEQIKEQLTIIKADPGYRLAIAIENGDSIDLVYEPIIAWAICHMKGDYDESVYARGAAQRGEQWEHFEVTPITIDGGPRDAHYHWAIKKSDDTYNVLGYAFDTEKEVLEYFRDKIEDEKSVREKTEQEHAG